MLTNQPSISQCLAPFAEGFSSPGEAKKIEVQRTRRARIGALNAGKTNVLDDVFRRVAVEAPRIAARCWDLWQTTGTFPKQAGKFKVLNLPSAALGQGLWTQVAGQMQSWLSNADHALRKEIHKYSQPKALVPITGRQALLDRQAFQAEFVGPHPKRSPFRRVKVLGQKATFKATTQQHHARWQNSLANDVQQALLKVQALKIPSLDLRPTMWSVMNSPARRLEGVAVTPVEQLVRALWLQVLDRCPQPSWRHMAWSISPNMGTIERVQESDQEKPSSTEGSVTSSRSPRQRQKRAQKNDARRCRPKATHHFILKLPEMNEWLSEKELIQDWREAVQEIEVYDTTSPSALLHRQKRQQELIEWKQACETAEQQGLPLPEKPKATPIWSTKDEALLECCLRAAGLAQAEAQQLVQEARDQVVPSGRKVRAKLMHIALPLFAGKDVDLLPGVMANTVSLLKPRAKKHRTQWEARLCYTVQAQDLQPSSRLGFNPTQKPSGILAMDAGVRTGVTTNVGLPGGMASRKGLALDDHGQPKPEGLSLEFLLENWGSSLEPLIQAVWKAAAGRQAQDLPVACDRHHRKEVRLGGRVKNELETVLTRVMSVLRPGFVVIEDLDLRGGKGDLSRETNRQVQRMGFGVARDWLIRNAPVYGFVLHQENPAFSSQQCSSCKFIHKDNRHGAIFKCLKCHRKTDADRNAALNLQERFLWGEWLKALGPEKAQVLGLEKASIEGWMQPHHVQQALLVRSTFLANEKSLLLAQENDWLPPEILVQAKVLQQ